MTTTPPPTRLTLHGRFHAVGSWFTDPGHGAPDVQRLWALMGEEPPCRYKILVLDATTRRSYLVQSSEEPRPDRSVERDMWLEAGAGCRRIVTLSE